MTHHHLNVQQATGAANLCFYSDGGYKTSIVLNYGSLTHGPPGCFTQSMATFVNYIHTIKITQTHLQSTNQPTKMGVALYQREVGHPWFKLSSLLTEVTTSLTKLN
jgi:hypothetical protein